MSKTERNVIVFGESGSGKSSLVNLLLGQKKAKVSDEAIGCTFNFQKYETPNFNLYDTVGLSEGVLGTVKQEFALAQLINLLRNLKNGVSLLVFVIEKGRIKQSLTENYKLFVETICMDKVPVVLVITHCEMETVQGTWWEQNKAHFDKYGMKFGTVVCGSSLTPDAAPPMLQSIMKPINDETVGQLLNAINLYALAEAWKVSGGWRNWFYAISKGIAKLIGGFFSSKSNDESLSSSLEDRLMGYFKTQGYDDIQANEMAKHIAIEMNSSS